MSGQIHHQERPSITTTSSHLFPFFLLTLVILATGWIFIKRLSTSDLPKMTTMKAWCYDSVEGGMIKNLQLRSDIQKPANATTLKKDEILIETITVTLNPADYKVPSFPVFGKILCPPTPGMDYSGLVAAIHSSNTDYKIGQAVFGRVNLFEFPKRTGALAQFLVAKRNECVPLPEGLSLDDAAAIGTAGLTAFDSLQFGNLNGKNVFINGGSGGVGIFTIQIAKIMGAKVTTTCSTPNVELCKDLGADEVIDYTVTTVLDVLKAGGRVYDLAIDNVGQDLSFLKHCETYLRPKASYVQVGGAGPVLAAAAAYAYIPCIRIGKNPVSMIGVKQSAKNLKTIAQWAVEGKLKMIFDSTYPLEEVPKAYERLSSGRARGKIAIRVSNAEATKSAEKPIGVVPETSDSKLNEEDKMVEEYKIPKTEEVIDDQNNANIVKDSKAVEELKGVEGPGELHDVVITEETKQIGDTKPAVDSKIS
jgi:NADPH:quinone reductase-like Zn-dependent oxidoreductase